MNGSSTPICFNQNIMKTLSLNSIKDWVFCAVYRTSKLLGLITVNHLLFNSFHLPSYGSESKKGYTTAANATLVEEPRKLRDNMEKSGNLMWNLLKSGKGQGIFFIRFLKRLMSSGFKKDSGKILNVINMILYVILVPANTLILPSKNHFQHAPALGY